MDFELMGELMGELTGEPTAEPMDGQAEGPAMSDPWRPDSGAAAPAGTVEALRAWINAAFAAVATGGGSLKALHRMLESPDADDQPPGPGDRDTARHWSDYDAEELEAHAALLPLLSVASWRFHLPAFLHAALDKLSQPVWETGLPGAVLFTLTYAADDPVWSRKLLDRFHSLDARQTAVVCAFLEFVSDHPKQEPLRGLDADKALRRYWRLQTQASLGARPADQQRSPPRSRAVSPSRPARVSVVRA